ncbi:MAG: extracellular solute-binding protein [Ardenticatenaceae bacterium]|nr:extracellular solute-binding protein [Ardenticatenaceae bacterium]HBY98440.1 bicyclomycin resistance protein [Chloroflexota bacterium]
MNERRFTLLALLLVAAVVLAACGGGGAATVPTPQVIEKVVTQVVEKEVTTVVEKEVEKEVTKVVEKEVVVPGTTITFWSTEEQPERAAATQKILKRFTEQSGINVELALTNEDALPSLVTAAVAAGTLPDVVFFPVDFAIGWAEQGILDPKAATQVINDLGKETFAQGPLNMVALEGNYAAVPTDGWGQLLIYRKDLFDKAGLDAPDTFDKIRAAAEKLNDPGNNFYGITAATDPGAVFTQQTWEHFALANGCQLVNDAGEVTLDSPQCVEAINFYADLMKNYAPAGVQDVVSTRATYFAGQAAMIVWSPFVLDEMAGLRDNAFPACPECKEDPAYLAKNSGIVPAFVGPSGSEPAQYGQVSYMGITANADVAAAQEFLKFWFNEGYLDWLAVSVEGKLPMRQGTPEEPTKFIDGWKQLETGVDRKARLGDIYGDEIINTLIQGAGSFDRWGFTQGQGALVTAVYESLVVPKALSEVLGGTLTPEEAATEMAAAVRDLKE